MKQPAKPIVMKLADNHSWSAPDGFKIVVMERGAALFNVPQAWVVTDFEPFTVRDAPVPKDIMGVQVSILQMPRGIDWSALPLANLLKQVMGKSYGKKSKNTEVFVSPRTDLALVWVETLFTDKKEKRDAYARTAVARLDGTHVVITFSFWVTDVEMALPVWDEVLRSLQLGLKIDDPRKGQTLH